MTQWRILRWAAWLGWQIDGNWANPWLFLIYVLIKPVTGVFLLVCMYWAVRAAPDSRVPVDYLPFLYISNACFMLIGGATGGMGHAVVSDRDSYGMLKYIRISPISMGTYLVGRGVHSVAQSTLGALLTILAGLVILAELRQSVPLSSVEWGWLGLHILLGVLLLMGLGFILASIALNLPRYGTFLADGVVGMLFLLSGTVFPLSVLPAPVQAISLLLPTTYWLEAMRRALIGRTPFPSPLDGLEQIHLAGVLLLCVPLLLGVALLSLRWNLRRAWEMGRFDHTSSY